MSTAVQGSNAIALDRGDGQKLSTKVYESKIPFLSPWFHNFVDFHKQMMKIRVENAMSYKEILRQYARDDKTLHKIDCLPEGYTLIHGNFGLDSLVVDDDNQLSLADDPILCRGPALYDVAKTYYLLRHDGELQKTYLKMMGNYVEDIQEFLEVIVAIEGV